ncbi:MAG: TolC family protein [Deltaproteobacteria bacterium]|nr:TolC family protein [Deltaproteobacteria bacterium]
MLLTRALALSVLGSATSVGLALLLVAPVAAADAAGDSALVLEEGIDVGSISRLDLDAVRLIIDQSDDVSAPVPARIRELSLEESVKTSLEQNLGLQIIELSEAQSQEAIRESKAKFHPSLEVGGAAKGTKINHDFRADESTDTQNAQALIRQEMPTGGRVGLGVGYQREFSDLFNDVVGDPTPGVNLQSEVEIAGLGIEISQPLLRGGRTYVARRSILDAEYDNEISRAELSAEILHVTADTKAAYYQVVRALRQIEVIQAALERDQQLVDASTALYDAGRVSKVDVLSADISQASNRARLASARADLELARNRLRQVIGLPITVQVDVTDRTIPFRPIHIQLQRWIRLALDRRPEMMKVQSQIEKADLTLRVTKNAALPSLDVQGAFQPGFDWASYAWNAGVMFQIPLGNVGPRSQVRQAEIQTHKMKRELAQQRRLIDLEVREVEIRLRENIERIKMLTAQVESARSKGEIARGRFEMGLSNNLDITNADEDLVRAESQLLEALVDYATNIAQLEARIGGPI